MADNQITPFQLTDQFIMDNFNQRINETNTALQNKAPAGYGLGVGSKKLTSNNDVNTIFYNGWYCWGGTSIPKNAPITGLNNLKSYTFMRVTNYDNNNVIQEYWNLNDNAQYKTQRICRGGNWQPIEWVNPPMKLGDEYRTTERYQGKPVYAKALSVGAITANNLSIVSTFSNEAETVVRCYAVAKYSSSMITTPQNGQYNGIHFTADGFVYATNNQVRVYVMSDTNMTDCVAVAYYTKA